MKKINLTVYYSLDEKGNKIYDEELMHEELENKLNKIKHKANHNNNIKKLSTNNPK